MSDYSNPYEPKPIEKVKNDIHSINQNLNKLKTDLITIRADISIIKDLLSKESKEKEEARAGWFY
tara:strand:- start:756 stop:950 length:195 start_codon:yes stop_codon:yes gene_type:complete